MVAVVEGTVGWVFNTGAPAAARVMHVAGAWMHTGAEWWVERGGPMLRDATETVVLEYLVPATAFTWHAVVATYGRALWLAAQTWQAATIIAADLSRDLRAVWTGMVAAVAWMGSRERWWFDPRLGRILQRRLADLRRLRVLFTGQVLPRCATVIEATVVWAYASGLCPAASAIALVGDWLLQRTSELGVHLYRAALVAGAALARLGRPLARASGRAFSWLRLTAQVLTAQLRLAAAWAVPIVSSAVAVCSDAYILVQDAVVVPLMRAATAAAGTVWRRVVALEPWLRAAWLWSQQHILSVLGSAFAVVCASGRRVQPLLALFVRALRTLQRRWCGLVREYGWDSCVELLSSGGAAMGPRIQLAVQWLQQHLAGLWPHLHRASRDGAQAMADVYMQLVALVDAVVVLIGDVVVNYARRNVVHAPPVQATSASTKKNA
ncbi:hypothetical protein IWW50_002737 [Coemansia erecta]|nr:hypothetical protein GGF43_003605 [Coemansia sp. RSA 2618]KAJ2825689.1 hypothetical protein IWW50_002737 [Coemansia erecta]